jgi:hypothetical protein
MGGFISKIMGGGLLEGVSSIIGKFKLDPTEAATLAHEVKVLAASREAQMEQTFRTEMAAKQKIIVAEMNQSDSYTKRARPTLVYVGLSCITFNYCLIPLLQTLMGITVVPFALPLEFWTAWGGTVGLWSLGRSFEKTGVKNNVVRMINGS